jgi:uncharacterized YigZ family protein
VADEIKRSRFITTIARAGSVPDAQAFIQSIRAESPDATHHCWAYAIGPPGSTAQIGMSDDGEPHGTAGRPMLNALLHSGVGDVAAVVTRYYGGTNLGTGGLVRAYGGGVQRALESMPRAERVEYVRATVTLEYGQVSAFEQQLPAYEAEVLDREFGADVRFTVRVPESGVEPFREAVNNLTRGSARIDVGADRRTS